MKKHLFVYVLILLFLGVSQAAIMAQEASDQASDDASIFLVHGIPGADLGEDPTFPVDIYINGIKKVINVKYGQIKGLFKITPGNTTISVYQAGQGPEAGYEPLLEENFNFQKNEMASVVGYLVSEDDVRLAKFDVDLAPAGDPSKNRVVIHNTSAETSLGIILANKGPELYPSMGATLLEPGDKFAGEIAQKGLYGAKKAFSWILSAFKEGRIDHPFYSKAFAVKPGQAALIYAVGSDATKTFKILKKLAKLR